MNTDLIKAWFEKFYGGSIKLPNGWFGKPFDNMHFLTKINKSKYATSIIIDDGMVNIILPVEFDVELLDKNLTISSNNGFKFQWIDYANRDFSNEESYSGNAQVTFYSH